MGYTLGTRVAATKVQAKLLSQKRCGDVASTTYGKTLILHPRGGRIVACTNPGILRQVRQSKYHRNDAEEKKPRLNGHRNDADDKILKKVRGKEQHVQAIVTKATNGLNKLRVENKETGVSRDIGLFTELPVQLANGRMEVKAHQSWHRTQDSNTMWRFANDHDSKGKATVWLFSLLSVCLSMIETSLHKKPAPLGNKEDLQKSGWVKAKAILKQGMSAPANLRVLYLPHLLWLLFTSNYEERLSQAHVCKLLGLDSFAKFQINSPFVSLEELYQEQIRLQCPRPNISTEHLLHEDEWRISVVEDSTPATAALAAGGVAITPGSSSSLEVARSQGTHIEASERSQEPQIQRSAVEPSSEVHTTSEELGPSFAKPTAPNVSGHETGIPTNVRFPREQNFPRYRSHSNPPSRHPAKTPHEAQQAPYRARTSGPQEEAPMQAPSTSLQLDHQSETDATHGLTLPSPELGGEADMTMKDIDPSTSPDSPTQDLPPFDVLRHELTRDGARRQQRRDPTPLPMPSNDNSALDKQSQSSPRTTPLIRMAVKTTSPPSEIPYENAESQDRDDTSGSMYSQGPQNRHSIVESSEEESTVGTNLLSPIPRGRM
ncbi:hypothetical protein BHE90_016581 [Fusarium euwallaceae]|uniref:Uncharacterized protein n=1 Tax=Fusarium euwallaceae TaxID=1147111 RepID=A0A430KZZ8_9HYPO|nr:hypothetical protein BHE90_016581 [Fusarium euwallaceae]